jgi:hypothetical protein
MLLAVMMTTIYWTEEELIGALSPFTWKRTLISTLVRDGQAACRDGLYYYLTDKGELRAERALRKSK